LGIVDEDMEFAELENLEEAMLQFAIEASLRHGVC